MQVWRNLQQPGNLRRFKLLITSVFIGLASGVILRFFGLPMVDASHPRIPDLTSQPLTHDHLHSVARPGLRETVCLGAEPGTGVNEAFARQLLADTLLADDTLLVTPDGWQEGVAHSRLRFSGFNSCSEPGSYPIEYKITEEPCFIIDGEEYSCAFPPSVLINNPYTQHHEFDSYNVWIWIQHWNLDAAGFINHETGHVLGLKDGGPDAPDPGDPPCPTDPPSVMHGYGYGCPSIQFPSSTDFESVRDNVVEPPPPSAGGAGFSKGLGF